MIWTESSSADWSVAMRSLVVAVSVFGMVSAAHAADLSDLPILRGGLTEGLNNSRVNWDGYYVGVQGGYGSSDENFNGSTSTMTAGGGAETPVERPKEGLSLDNKIRQQNPPSSGVWWVVGF